jgi:hypothetical protein
MVKTGDLKHTAATTYVIVVLSVGEPVSRGNSGSATQQLLESDNGPFNIRMKVEAEAGAISSQMNCYSQVRDGSK